MKNQKNNKEKLLFTNSVLRIQSDGFLALLNEFSHQTPGRIIRNRDEHLSDCSQALKLFFDSIEYSLESEK